VAAFLEAFAIARDDDAGVAAGAGLEEGEGQGGDRDVAEIEDDRFGDDAVIDDHLEAARLEVEVRVAVQIAGGIDRVGDIKGLVTDQLDLLPDIAAVLEAGAAADYASPFGLVVIDHLVAGHLGAALHQDGALLDDQLP